MKIPALSLLIMMFCSACDNRPDNTQPKQGEVPAPLADKSSEFNIMSKGIRGNSLVDLIYSDLLEKDPGLQKLEEELSGFEKAKIDSLKAFDVYNDKSQNYYSSAERALLNISDTVLRVRLKALLANSESRYKLKIAKFTMLEKDIASKDSIIKDYRQTLKIVATLPIMEGYQGKSIPDIKSAAEMAKQAAKLKYKTIKLAEQYQAKAEK